MPKVAIVIPSLNAQPYIKECIDSVVKQTMTDIEIFCVDAASTDGTKELLEEYAQRDSRITIIEDTARSTGYAKNLGIKLAKSKYVAIVEPDDYIALDMMEKLYETAEKFDADIVKGNFRSFLGDGESRLVVDKAVSSDSRDYYRVIDPQADSHCFGWEMFTWTGLYKKEFLEKHQILHNETKGAASQDVGFWFLTMCYAGRVYLLRDYFYYYRKDNPNASMKNPGRIYTMCDEYGYIKKTLSADRETWGRVETAYYHGMFHDYFVTCGRIADSLRPAFLERYYREIKAASEQGKIVKELFDSDELEYLETLLQSKENFLDKFRTRQNNVQSCRQGLWEKIAGYEHCIIFSAGSHGGNLQVILKQSFGKDITAFCDNDVKKQGGILNGARILSLREASECYPEAVYLIANKKHAGAVMQQLLGRGIPEERIVNCKIEDIVDSFL